MYRKITFMPISFFLRIFLLGSFAFLSACGGSGGNNNDSSESLTPQNLSFSQAGEQVKIFNVDDHSFSNTLNGVQSSGALTYTSSNLAVATVNAQGVITIVGEGETTISVRSEGDSDYLTASTSFLLRVLSAEPLSQPQLTVRTDIKKITLEWPQVEGAHHYNVFHCEAECEKLPLDIRAEFNPGIIEVDQHISALSNAKSHTYRVQACNEDDTLCSDQSLPVSTIADAAIGYFKAPLEHLTEDAVFGAAVAISLNGELAISAPDEVIDEAQNIRGAVYIYDNHENGVWQFKTRIANTMPNSDFGFSMDMHFLGSRLVVSGSSANTTSVLLMAHIYDRGNDDSWDHSATLTLDTQGAIAGRNSHVAMSSLDTVAISSAWGNGSVAIFQHSQDQGWQQEWLQQGGAGFDALSYTDITIDSNDDTFAIASEKDDQLMVKILKRDSDTGEWQNEHEIVRALSDLNHSEIALADRGNLLAVSVSSEVRMEGETTLERVGAVHLYRRDEEGWQLVETIQPNLPADTRFGYALALAAEGRHLVVGSDDPSLEQPVFIFQLNEEQQWVQVEGGNITTRKMTDGNYLDNYGEVIDISFDGRDIVVSAHDDDDLVSQPVTPLSEKNTEGESKSSGAAYLF